MLPVIALIGRPNVGKSTLFNRLTRTRAALVADFPGLTRDRQYGSGKIGPAPYIIIDTGGLDSAPEGIMALMAQQVKLAIAEADHIIFLVNAKDGCTPEDLTISEFLRRTGKSLILAVNKCDGTNTSLALADFHLLGLGEPHPISATHGHGVIDLIEQILSTCQSDSEDSPEISPVLTSGIRIAIVGRPNVGKSTLINRMLGAERLVASDRPGTTRDSIFIPYEHRGRQYTLIDTAGVRRRTRVEDKIEKFSVIKTLKAIEASQVGILLLDAQQGIGEQDANLAAYFIESGRALLVAINKWDGLTSEQRDQVKQQFARRLAFLDFARLYFISALHGTGVGLLLEEVDRAYTNATRDLPTPILNHLLSEAIQAHQPPLIRGRRIKLRYAHQGGRNPPVIVIHGNQTAEVPDTYRRYLINYFRGELGLDGTPLRLEFKTGTNPFQEKQKITPARKHKINRSRHHK